MSIFYVPDIVISDFGFWISDSGLYLFLNPQLKIRNRAEGELGEANPQ